MKTKVEAEEQARLAYMSLGSALWGIHLPFLYCCTYLLAEEKNTYHDDLPTR